MSFMRFMRIQYFVQKYRKLKNMRVLVLNTIANQTKETQTLLQNIKEKYANETIYNTYEMNIKHCRG